MHCQTSAFRVFARNYQPPWHAGIAAPGRNCRPVYQPLTMRRQGAQRGRLMRINGPNGLSYGVSQNARRSASAGFSLPATADAAESRATSAPRAAGGIDALLALQGVSEDPAERRRRSVQRGRGALDILDEIRVGLLAGGHNVAGLARLKAAAAELKQSSGDPGLDAVLGEIELRVEVELAKASRS
jgi:hypothetical protein